MEIKFQSKEHELHHSYNGNECAKQHEDIRDYEIELLSVNMANI